MYENDGIQRSLDHVVNNEMTRRNLIKRMGLMGLTAVGFSALLASCAEDTDDSESTGDNGDAVAEEDEDEATAESEDEEATAAEEDTEADGDEDADNEGGEPQEGGEVRFHYGSAPRTFNPLFSTSNREHAFEALMYGALAKINDGFEAILDLAENLEVSDDATEYTFTLHDGITFTDGEQLTSEDVRFTFESALNPATGSVWRGDFLGIAGAEEFGEGATDSVEGILTPDDLTVTFTLASPNAVFLLSICGTAGFGILPSHVLTDVPPEDLQDHEFSSAPTVTAGAYKFVRYETDQFIEWERHEEYFGDRPYIDRIFGLVLEPSVAVAQLETGELDIIPELEFGELERTRGMEHVTVHSVQSGVLAKLTINLNREYFQDKRVRQAMAYAIDNQGILDAAIQGEGVVVHHPFIAPDWAREIEAPIEYAYDSERASQLLEEAGWDSEQRIQLSHHEGINQWWLTTLTFIQDLWADAGIQADIVSHDFADLNVMSIENDDFDLLPFSGSSGDPDAHSDSYTTQNLPPDGLNRSRYSNERVDELFAEGRATGNVEERQEIYSELVEILNDELPELYLFSPNNLSAYSNRLAGYSAPAFRDNTLWDATEWYISE